MKIFGWLEGWFKTTVRKSTRVAMEVARTSQENGGVAGGELLLICAMHPLPPSVSLEKTSMPQEEQEEGPCHIAHRVPWGKKLRNLATQSSALILSVVTSSCAKVSGKAARSHTASLPLGPVSGVPHPAQPLTRWGNQIRFPSSLGLSFPICKIRGLDLMTSKLAP